MQSTKKLLLIVDYQFDFAAPDGLLTAGEPALTIGAYLKKRAEEYLSSGQDIVFTLDTHTLETWDDHPESGSFPIHCVKGTPGWQIYGELNQFIGREQVSTVEKAAYCPDFTYLERWVKDYDVIEIMGLVTNICVLHTAVGLYTAKVNLGQPVRLIVQEQGCASFDEKAHFFALAHMKDTLGMRP